MSILTFYPPTSHHQKPLVTAIQYANLGLRVIPLHTVRNGSCTCWQGSSCSAPGKHPRLRGWPRKASTDEGTIRRWWKTWPGANVGIVSGPESGILVLDIDPRNGGGASFSKLEAEIGPMPATVETLTGGGGRHLYFLHPSIEGKIRGTPGKDYPGIDVKASGLVVAPPSLHASGKQYKWRERRSPKEIGLAACPQELIELLQVSSTTGDKEAYSKIFRPKRSDPDLLIAIKNHVKDWANAHQGTRNNATFQFAGRLVTIVHAHTKEGLAPTDIEDIVREWNDTNDPPLSEHELIQTVRSALDGNGTPPPLMYIHPSNPENPVVV